MNLKYELHWNMYLNKFLDVANLNITFKIEVFVCRKSKYQFLYVKNSNMTKKNYNSF